MLKFPSAAKSPDIILLIVTLILVTVGTVMIYSSSSIMAMERFKDAQFFLKKQVLFVFMGVALMILLQRIPFDMLKKFAYPGVILSVILLVLVMIPHVGVKVGGASRWLRLGFFSFQVTEFVKLVVVLFLAHYLTRKSDQIKELGKGIIIPLFTTMVLVGLIVIEPDFGTAVIITTILMLMLYLAGSQVRYLAGMAALFIPIGIWILFSKSYRVERLMTFLNPWRDPQHTGFQIIQSLLSFGSGGAFGVGVGDGMQKLFYLPEPHTDFILSVIAEESGFMGVFIIIALFGVFVFRGFMISFKAPDRFSSLLASGVTMIIALEAFINIAGVMGLIPLKGLALPFLSYGGTSLIMSLCAVGILLNISSHTT